MSYAKSSVAVGLFFSFLLWISPTSAGTISQTFAGDKFDTEHFSVNSSKDPAKSSVAVADGRLELTVPTITSDTGAAGFQLSGVLDGDYDIQVDFSLLEWPADNHVKAGIITPLYEVVRVNTDFGQGSTDAYMVYFSKEQQQGQGTIFHSVPAFDNSGKLRLTRKGNEISSWYWHGDSWWSIASCSAAEYGEPISFYVGGYAGVRNSGGTTKVRFDNLKVSNHAFGSSFIKLFKTLLGD
jgi:hypothetical protein